MSSQNPYFAPNPWTLGTPASWAIEGQHARSLGGLDALRCAVDAREPGDYVTFRADVENPDGSELDVALGSNALYSGVPAAYDTITVTVLLGSPANTLTIKDVSGEGTLRLTNVRLLA